MVEEAVPVPMVAPTGLESTTSKVSSGSTVVSPATLTGIVLLVSPAAKLTVPDGKTAPAKSDPAAGLAPLPVTAQRARVAMLVVPPRVAVKVKAVLPDCPAALSALRAAIDRLAWLTSSLRIVPPAD